MINFTETMKNKFIYASVTIALFAITVIFLLQNKSAPHEVSGNPVSTYQTPSSESGSAFDNTPPLSQTFLPERVIETEEYKKIATPTGWRTYRSPSLGFILKYPKNWFVDESPNVQTSGTHVKLAIVSPERKKNYDSYIWSADVYVYVHGSLNELSGEEDGYSNLEEWLQDSGGGNGLYDIKKTTFAGEVAFTALSGSEDEADPQIYIEHNGKIYIIQGLGGDESQMTLNKTILDSFTWVE